MRDEKKYQYNKEQYLKHREQRLESMRAYRHANREQLNARRREQYNDHKKSIKQQWEEKQSAEKCLLKAVRNRAARKGIAFDLELRDIVIPNSCPVLGIELKRSKGGISDNSPSVDRLVPSLGYVKGNVRIISLRANRIKTDACLEELEKVVAYVKRELFGD